MGSPTVVADSGLSDLERSKSRSLRFWVVRNLSVLHIFAGNILIRMPYTCKTICGRFRVFLCPSSLSNCSCYFLSDHPLIWNLWIKFNTISIWYFLQTFHGSVQSSRAISTLASQKKTMVVLSQCSIHLPPAFLSTGIHVYSLCWQGFQNARWLPQYKWDCNWALVPNA